jgi:hypothetical protein
VLHVALANSDSERSKIGVNLGTITALYRNERLPTLRKSTRERNAYFLRDFIEPKWAKGPLQSVTPLKVVGWIGGSSGLKDQPESKARKPLAANTKAGIRSVMRQCFELAAHHGYFPTTDRNPISLVKIKGTTKRERETIILGQEQFRNL